MRFDLRNVSADARVERRGQIAGQQRAAACARSSLRDRAPARRRSAPWCRDAAGRRRSRRASASSTTRPRYSTITRWEICRTTDRSWLMKISARPNSRLQRQDQVDDLRLDRDVERADRLVADHQLRPQDHRAGDADALVLAAGEFVRIAVDPGRIEPDLLHDRAHALRALSSRDRSRLERPQRLGDGLADRHARIEAGQRVLEDDLELLAQRAQLVPRRLAHRSAAAARPPCPPSAAAAAAPRAPSVDLPQPHSPTTPSVSPSLRVKLTPSTARSGLYLRKTCRSTLDREMRPSRPRPSAAAGFAVGSGCSVAWPGRSARSMRGTASSSMLRVGDACGR